MKGLIFLATWLICILPEAALQSHAQDRRPVDILNADQILYDARIVEADRLIGNVRLRYEGSILNCDSAWRYPNGNFEAYSRVHINKGDSLRLYGDYMLITRNEREVRLRNNIRLIDNEMTLTTDRLVYDLRTGKARYRDGGVIRSTKNDNILTSVYGTYDKDTEFFHFRKNVVLTNPEYEVFSDTLRYHNVTEIAYFEGPSTILSKESTIYCNKGWFNTQTDESRFSNGAEVHSGTNILRGDSLIYDSQSNFGEVFRNVFMQDTTSNYYITGNYGWHNEQANRSLVTDSAVMVQFMGDDSLFLHADTLRAVPDSLDRRQVLAFYHVKFFKEDLQGKCDSLVYMEQDSTINMFGRPILWSLENQISGRQIRLLVFGGEIHRMDIDAEALVVSIAAPESYNQISGRELTGFFKESKLNIIEVRGNGQVVYYPEDDKEGGVIGVNRADCSEMVIHVDDNRIERVIMLRQPTGALHPMSKAAQTDRFLKNFFWETDNRPLSRDAIFYWARPESAEID